MKTDDIHAKTFTSVDSYGHEAKHRYAHTAYNRAKKVHGRAYVILDGRRRLITKFNGNPPECYLAIDDRYCINGQAYTLAIRAYT